jgi:hypothetical protein
MLGSQQGCLVQKAGSPPENQADHHIIMLFIKRQIPGTQNTSRLKFMLTCNNFAYYMWSMV